MKTTLLNLIIACSLLASCNMGKRYADYRRGGNHKEETVAIQNDSVVLLISKTETATPEVSTPESISSDTAISIQESKPAVEKKRSAIKEGKTIIRKKNISQSVEKTITPIKKSIASIKTAKKKTSAQSKIDWGDVWDVLVGIFLIGSLVISVVAYLASVNFAIGEIIMMVLLIALAILLCVGLSALITGMFPGMSRRKKNSKFHR